jgi:hypothetical protein
MPVSKSTNSSPPCLPTRIGLSLTGRAEDIGRAPQRNVSELVPEPIVDGLEMIDIAHDDGRGSTPSLRPVERNRGGLIEALAVEKPRQGVNPGEPVEFIAGEGEGLEGYADAPAIAGATTSAWIAHTARAKRMLSYPSTGRLRSPRWNHNTASPAAGTTRATARSVPEWRSSG